MLSRNRTFLVAVLGLIALAWIAKLVWNTTLPYRSARLAAKIKTLSDQGERSEAVELLETSLSRLTLADEYSCKVHLVKEKFVEGPGRANLLQLVKYGLIEGPSPEQVLMDAKARGLPEDSLFSWKMEFGIAEAINASFSHDENESKTRLKHLAREALHRRPDDSLTFLIRALSHFQFHEFDECQKLVDQSFSRWPESFRFRMLKGRSLVARGRYDSALKVIPDPDSVQREDYNPLYPSAKSMRRSWLVYDWYGAAMVGAHGVKPRRFAWDVKACGGLYFSDPWSGFSSSACEIHKRLHPNDTAGQCLQFSVDLDDYEDLDTIQKLSKIFGGPPKCPEWAKPARSEKTLTNPLTEQEQTDCLFGTGDSTKDARCPE